MKIPVHIQLLLVAMFCGICASFILFVFTTMFPLNVVMALILFIFAGILTNNAAHANVVYDEAKKKAKETNSNKI